MKPTGTLSCCGNKGFKTPGCTKNSHDSTFFSFVFSEREKIVNSSDNNKGVDELPLIILPKVKEREEKIEENNATKLPSLVSLTK